MTTRKYKLPRFVVLLLALGPVANAQTIGSLHAMRNVYVGSLGDQPGATELREELINALKRSHALQVTNQAQADAQLTGIGEIWIRGYHSLSPRARGNDVYAEPYYGGYLSVTTKGKDGQILWSYFANPKGASFGDNVKHELAAQIVDKLTDAIQNQTSAPLTSQKLTSESAVLKGAGATFPYPVYAEWFASFHAADPKVLIDYEPIGSDAGIRQFVASALDFAGSDIPVSAFRDLPAHVPFLEFPSVVGAVVVIYNLPQFAGDLRLTPQVLADIFSGRITRWNDPALRAINHGSGLPDKPIRIVHRSDGSGTTYALTEYLTKSSDSWKQSVGQGSTVNWPVGSGANGNEGVSNTVKENPYSLGYTEFIYAFKRRLSFASIRNADGEFVQAGLPSIISAAEHATGDVPTDFAISLANAPGRDSYPIATYTRLVVPAQLTGSPKAEALRQFLDWMLVSGQRQCMSLGYAPLPRSLAEREQKVLHDLNP